MRSDLINAGGAPHVLGKGTGPALGSYAVSGVAEVRYIAKPTIAEALFLTGEQLNSRDRVLIPIQSRRSCATFLRACKHLKLLFQAVA